MRYVLFAAIRRASVVLSLLVALSTPLLWDSPAKAGTTLTQMNAACVPAGITITSPGEYDLGGDVTCTAALGGDGIDIETSGVTLRLNGHTISSMCPSVLPSPSVGIHVNPTGLPTLAMVRIFGDGTISGFDRGVVADDSAGSFAKSVTITNVCQVGILINSPSSSPSSLWKLHKNVVTNAPTGILLLGDDNDLVLNNVSGANTNEGIFVSSSSNNNTIVNNTASMNTAASSHGIHIAGTNNDLHANTTDNNSVGIFVEGGVGLNNNITGNESSGNTSFDMVDENGPPFNGPTPCDNNKWRGNHFVTANRSCIN